MTRQITLGDIYIMVCAGSILIVPNPDWDGDKPETHFNYKVLLNEDACVDLGSADRTRKYSMTIIEREQKT